MKKVVINGKVYNTETAELLHKWSNGYYYTGFKLACREALYRTKRGAYFLAGEGGALSKYAQSHGNMRSGGGGITPLDEAGAIKWLEHHDGANVLMEHFSGAIEEA